MLQKCKLNDGDVLCVMRRVEEKRKEEKKKRKIINYTSQY